MTNNSKKRKFLATSLTATMVATAVAPVAGFAATAQEDFTDVAGHWGLDAINYLYGKDVLNGYSDNTFRPDNSITRAEAAKILAKTLGLNIDEDAKTDFEDTKNHWASPYVAAIQDQAEGVINGYKGKFNPEDPIKRQEFAKMIANAYKDLELNENAVVDFPDNNDWGKADVELLASLGIVQGDKEGFRPNDEVKRVEAATFVHRTEVPAERVDVPQKEVTDLVVESVSAINAGELQVKFTSPIDSAIATKNAASPTGYYLSANDILKLDGTALAATQPVSLSKDGKTLTIVATTAQNFVGGHTLEVLSGKVKDADSNAHITGGKFEFTLSADNTRPTLVGTTYEDAKTVVVEFSEPIKSQTTIASFEYADGTAVTTGGVTQTALVVGSKTIEFTLDPTKLTAGKDIKVLFTDASDFNGNYISPVSTTFKFTEDTTKPVASAITAVANNQFTVKLSKDISTVDVTKIKLNDTALASGTAGSLAAGEASYVVDNTNKLVTITLGTTQAGVVPIVIGDDAFVDALGNKSVAIASQLVNFKPETVAPTLVSSEVKSINNKQHLLLTFNENVTAKTLTASVATFTYDDANGVTKTIVNNNTLATSLYQPVSGKSKVVAIDLTTVTDGTNTLNTNSTAKVTFAPGFATDLFGNESAVIKDVQFNTSHTGSTAPRLEVTAVNAVAAKPGVVEVVFNERVDIASARNVNNYKINGLTPKEAIITDNTAGSVKVELVAQDEKIAATGYYDVVVSGVKASASTVLDQQTKTASVSVVENVRPTVSGVEIVALGATSKIKVTFSEAVKETTQNGDYELFVNGTKVVVATTAAAVTTATKEITFDVANDLTTTLAQTSSVVELRSTLTNDFVDAAGNKVNASVIKIK